MVARQFIAWDRSKTGTVPQETLGVGRLRQRLNKGHELTRDPDQTVPYGTDLFRTHSRQ